MQRGANSWDAFFWIGHFPQKRRIISGSFAERIYGLRHPTGLGYPVCEKRTGVPGFRRSGFLHLFV